MKLRIGESTVLSEIKPSTEIQAPHNFTPMLNLKKLIA
jgi:hypothetical protein